MNGDNFAEKKILLTRHQRGKRRRVFYIWACKAKHSYVDKASRLIHEAYLPSHEKKRTRSHDHDTVYCVLSSSVICFLSHCPLFCVLRSIEENDNFIWGKYKRVGEFKLLAFSLQFTIPLETIFSKVQY
ncbi:hypothetical protein QL285_085117 [Trifolium repens]|nr:hypothetical protein QL285_085117 [Trifolium repens]